MLSAMRDAYSLTDAFTRWRPSPRMSYCTPRRGERRRALGLAAPSGSNAGVGAAVVGADDAVRVDRVVAVPPRAGGELPARAERPDIVHERGIGAQIVLGRGNEDRIPADERAAAGRVRRRDRRI